MDLRKTCIVGLGACYWRDMWWNMRGRLGTQLAEETHNAKFPTWHDIFLLFKVFAPQVLSWTFTLLFLHKPQGRGLFLDLKTTGNDRDIIASKKASTRSFDLHTTSFSATEIWVLDISEPVHCEWKCWVILLIVWIQFYLVYIRLIKSNWMVLEMHAYLIKMDSEHVILN